jgi:hypothetical protein
MSLQGENMQFILEGGVNWGRGIESPQERYCSFNGRLQSDCIYLGGRPSSSKINSKVFTLLDTNLPSPPHKKQKQSKRRGSELL